MNTAQNKAIHALLHKLHLMQNKASIVLGISGGRTDSCSRLTAREASDLIRWLKGQDPDEIMADKMRKKIFYYAHQMGITKTASGGHRVVDMALVDRWMIKYSYLHKTLNQYTLSELPTLVSQFEKVYKTFIKNF
jgi:hypothetical protein